MRIDKRQVDELRPVHLKRDFQIHPAGSVLVECGRTRVICAVTVQDGVPRWMREQNVPGGWITGEYQMLPSATSTRTFRESSRGGPSGRTQEIQRLIGRSLRAVVDMTKLGARTCQVDCDVIDADGGTRCAAITGSCVALELALRKLFLAGAIKDWPMSDRVAAVSVGIVGGKALLDLCYAEDVEAEVDMNVVMTGNGRFIEVQGTAEKQPFTQPQMDRMVALARGGIGKLGQFQQQALD